MPLHGPKVGGSSLRALADGQESLTTAVKFIFSWVILLPIAVIVTGKLLNQRMKLQAGSGQLFRIPVKGVLTIQSTGAEVILGFACYLILMLGIGALVGAHVELWVKQQFGIEPGQFYALGFVTSLGSVALSFAIFLMTKNRPSEAQEQRLKRHDKIVDELTERQTGIDPKTLDKDIEP